MATDKNAAQVEDLEDFDFGIVGQAAFPSPDYESGSFDSSPSPVSESNMSAKENNQHVTGEFNIKSPLCDDADFMSELKAVNLADLIESDNENCSAELFNDILGCPKETSLSFASDIVDVETVDQQASIDRAVMKACEAAQIRNSVDTDSDTDNDTDYKPVSYNLRARDGNMDKALCSPMNPVKIKVVSIQNGPSSTHSSGKEIPAQQKVGVATQKRPMKRINVTPSYLESKRRRESMEKDLMYMSEVVQKSDDKCLNRNAVNARENRQKKKAYIQGLENDVSCLSTENSKLKLQVKNFEVDVDSLTQEVAYLKNVLANQSMLSNLLKNIENVKDVKLSSSFSLKRKSAVSDLDHNYGVSRSTSRHGSDRSNVSGGVCLHVDQNNVSLEFCQHCATKALRSWMISYHGSDAWSPWHSSIVRMAHRRRG